MENTAGFTLAAYVVTFTLIGAYTWRLARRLARARAGRGERR